MQVSKKNVNRQIEAKIFKSLYQVLADLKNPLDVAKFIEDVLSETEKTVLAKRLAIAWYLTKNRPYELIRQELKVSSATIAAVQHLLDGKKAGMLLAVKTMEAEEWAGELAAKVKASVKKIFKK